MNIFKQKLGFKTILLILVATWLTFSSCQDLIEVDLPDDKINREDIYNDLATTKSALNFLYTRIRDTPLFSSAVQGLSINLSLYTDELIYYGSTNNPIFLNSIDAEVPSYTEHWWNNSYKDVYAINAFIEGVTNSSSIKEIDKKQLLGEAYTLRALFYQTLTKLFGNIPYTTTTNYLTNTTISKTNYADVLIQIEKDLLLALDLLDYSYRNVDRIYINKAVSELLLTENYLLQQRYDLAEVYAQNIIDNSTYQLEDNLDYIFLKDAKSTLLQISPTSLPRTTDQANYYLFTNASVTSALNPDFYDTFQNSDLRKTNWIQDTVINGVNYHQVFKYKNKLNNVNELGVFFRLEEAYFYLAEAQVYQEKIVEAIKTLNKIRVKRGLAGLSLGLSKETFITELLIDANKEFFSESGHRFFDLKRNGRIQDLANSKSTWKPYNDLLPIPQKQILINRNLLPNNPGY
ncbi:RagB/SusD family nutrient uptake outer membrane protein [Myroides sp. LJL115]